MKKCVILIDWNTFLVLKYNFDFRNNSEQEINVLHCFQLFAGFIILMLRIIGESLYCFPAFNCYFLYYNVDINFLLPSDCCSCFLFRLSPPPPTFLISLSCQSTESVHSRRNISSLMVQNDEHDLPCSLCTDHIAGATGLLLHQRSQTEEHAGSIFTPGNINLWIRKTKLDLLIKIREAFVSWIWEISSYKNKCFQIYFWDIDLRCVQKIVNIEFTKQKHGH